MMDKRVSGRKERVGRESNGRESRGEVKKGGK